MCWCQKVDNGLKNVDKRDRFAGLGQAICCTNATISRRRVLGAEILHSVGQLDLKHLTDCASSIHEDWPDTKESQVNHQEPARREFERIDYVVKNGAAVDLKQAYRFAAKGLLPGLVRFGRNIRVHVPTFNKEMARRATACGVSDNEGGTAPQ